MKTAQGAIFSSILTVASPAVFATQGCWSPAIGPMAERDRNPGPRNDVSKLGRFCENRAPQRKAR
jgi:hypothetical protein